MIQLIRPSTVYLINYCWHGSRPSYLFLLVLFLPLSITFFLLVQLRTGLVRSIPHLHTTSSDGSNLRSEVTNTTISFEKKIHIDDYNITYHDFNYLDSRTLTYQKRIYPNDVEVLFRLPKKVSISALLLIFHGCSHTAYDWFNTIERQRIIGSAIDLGFGCLAFETTNNFSFCWSTDTNIGANIDMQMVFKGLEGFFKEFPKLGQ